MTAPIVATSDSRPGEGVAGAPTLTEPVGGSLHGTVAANATRPSLMPTAYPHVLGSAACQVASVALARWDLALRFVRQVQERALRRIVEHARHTEIGRAWTFSAIRGYDDFARLVPIGDYDSHSPYIQRMLAGERNVLVPEFVRYFGNSSGSSNHGRSKFLPITDRQIRLQQASGADAVMRYLRWSGDADFFSGFTLGLFPSTEMRREGPALITSNPALMMTKMPLVTRPMYLPEDDVRTIANYDEKLAVMRRDTSTTTCAPSLERLAGSRCCSRRSSPPPVRVGAAAGQCRTSGRIFEFFSAAEYRRHRTCRFFVT